MKLNLIKSKFNLLKKANGHLKEILPISFCYEDVKKFQDRNQEYIFFSTFDELRDVVDSEN